MIKLICLSLLLFLGFLVNAQPIPVTITTTANGHVMMRNGSPYFIKGAGGDAFPDRLKEYGGNSIRTWGTDASTITMLDQAHQLGLTVMMGLWVGHQEHGFDYNNTIAVRDQLEAFRLWVRQYKDHPAVLAWGIGNEVELNVSSASFNKKAWDAINEIAVMIHAEDGNHPTLTITAGIDVGKAKDIMQRAPALDLIGVNAYAGIGGVAGTLATAGWQKPHVITEWGPNGPWEVSKTTWGAELEQTSTEKAALYKSRYESAILGNPEKCLGSYVFLWADKVEGTPTWFGLFMPTTAGEETEVVDVMNYLWSGAWPANRAPKIVSAKINTRSASQSPVLINDVGNIATIEVTDAENDPLTYEFLFRPETGTAGTTNSPPATITYLPGLIVQQNSTTITFRAPANLQNYRLYVFVRDNHNNVATANIPFRVALEPLTSTDPATIYATMDAYVRAGTNADERYGVTDIQRLLTRLDPSNESNVRESYVGFDVSSINKGIDKVLLKIVGGGTPGVKTSVLGLRNKTWSENQITWTNKPITTAQELKALDTITIGNNIGYYEWNVTSFVNQARFEKEGFVTFLIRNITPSDNPTNWQSRETRPSPPALAFTLNDGNIVTSLEDETLNGTHIYPNPFSNSFFVNALTSDPIKQTSVYSLAGQLLYSKEINSTTTEIILGNDLLAGLYLLQIQWSNKGVTYHKLIKE